MDGGSWLSDAEESGVDTGMDVDGGMKNFSDGGDASDETRAGARDVAIGVERVDLAIADGGDGMPLGRKSQREIFVAGLFLGIAAGSEQENVGGGGEDFFQSDAEGRSFGLAEEINATRARDHLRNPMAANIKRLKPLEKNDAGAIDGVANLQLDFGEPGADGFDEGFGTEGAAGYFADQEDVAPDITEFLRIETKHFRAIGEPGEGGGEIVGRGCAYVAKILGDDEIGGKLFEEIGVDGVEAFTTGGELAN